MTDEQSSEHKTRSLSGFTGSGYDKGRSRPWQVAWLIVDSLVFRRWWLPSNARVSVLRRFGATIGDGVLVRHDVRIHWPWKLSLGDNVWIGVGAWILNLEPVTIGRDSCISQEAMLCTGSHDRLSPTFEFDNGPITIGERVWVAARATVLRGVTIGNDAIVGACALVTRDVPASGAVFAPRTAATTGIDDGSEDG